MVNRRFPPLWSVEEEAAYYVVRDHDGQQLAYVYFEGEAGRRDPHLSRFGRICLPLSCCS